jgi:hypothetical protein
VSSWDTGPFDNDGAMNFVGDLDQANFDRTTARIVKAMMNVISAPAYVSAAEVNLAVAAACLVAGKSGARNAIGSPFVLDWLTAAVFDATPELRSMARAVFERAFQPGDNEWFDLWDAGGRLDDVRQRLDPFLVVVATA